MALKITMTRTLILICLLFNVKIFAQQEVVLSIGQSMQVPLMGYNSDMSNTPKWSNTEFNQALKKLNTSTLRYHGGSNSLYWNWKKVWTLTYEQLIPILQQKNFSFKGKRVDNANQLKQLTTENRKTNSFLEATLSIQ